MAYVLSGSPDTFTPVFNPVVFYPYSTNYTSTNFKYLIDIFSAGTSSRVARLKLFPRPNDYLGIANIATILESKVGSFFNPSQPIFTPATPNFFKYSIQFGEEYTTEYTITSAVPGATSATTIFTINLGTSINPFSLGTLVDIVNAVPSVYNGTYDILAITGNVLTLGFEYTTGLTSGKLVLTNRGPSLYTGITTFNGTVFNGAISHQSFPDYTSTAYNLVDGGSTIDFLTNYPDCYRVKSDNCMWWMAYSTNIHPQGDVEYLEVATPYSTKVFLNNTATGSAFTMLSINVGPCAVATGGTYTTTATTATFVDKSWNFIDNAAANVYGWVGGNVGFVGNSVPPFVAGEKVQIAQDSGYLNSSYEGVATVLSATTISGGQYLVIIDKAFGVSTPANPGVMYQKTSYYDVTILGSLNPRKVSSKTRRICLDDRCSKYENIELYFQDRLGSIIPVNFALNHTESVNVTRSQYQKYLGDISGPGGKYTYDSKDRGRTQIGMEEVKIFKCNTDFLTNSEANFLRELYTSPNVWMKENGKFWPIVITDTSLELTTKNNKKNFFYSVTFEMANNDPINTL